MLLLQGNSTGISSERSAKTVRGLYNVVSVYLSGDREGARRKLRKEFQTPGRVPILVSRGLRAGRRSAARAPHQEEHGHREDDRCSRGHRQVHVARRGPPPLGLGGLDLLYRYNVGP